MKVEGTVIEIGPLQSGVSKADKGWKMRTVVIEFEDGDYTKNLAVSFFNVDKLDGIKEGDEVEIECNVDSKKYNDRWFTNVGGWKIEVTREGSMAEAAEDTQEPPVYNEPQDENDLPF